MQRGASLIYTEMHSVVKEMLKDVNCHTKHSLPAFGCGRAPSWQVTSRAWQPPPPPLPLPSAVP